MSNDIRLIKLNNYVRPKLQENKGRGWVLNGKNNEFYKTLIDRKNGSPTHSTILNSYNHLFYGNGLNAKNNLTNIQDFLKLKTIFKKDDIRRIISDFNLFGEASIFVVKDRKGDLSKIEHVANEKIAPSIENEDGEIDSYWFCKDWKNTSKYPPEEFSSFGTSKDAIEIYKIKPYVSGCNYFSDPEYMAGIPYAQMEEEIANLYVNSIRKGLSAGYIINIPDGNSQTEEEKNELEDKIKNKLTGSPNAMSFVINFHGRDAEITVTPFPVNDNVHKQWQYLTGEARQQLFTAHGIVSPILFGVKEDTGFGNNANEMDAAFDLLMKMKVNPKQRYFLEAIDDILNFYGINLDLYFLPLTDTTQATDVGLSEKKNQLDTVIADSLIDLGEDVSDEWELINSEILTNETAIDLAKTGTARPNAKSKELDGDKFKSRLRYGGELSANSRDFCRKMINANKLYRIEDIRMMSKNSVNAGWGANGADNYDILLYKGGGACRHFWIRETYTLKSDVNNPNAEIITPSKARKEGEILPKIDKKAYQKPNNMPNNGFLKKR